MKLLIALRDAIALCALVAVWLVVEIADATRENRLKRQLGRHYEGPAADDF